MDIQSTNGSMRSDTQKGMITMEYYRLSAKKVQNVGKFAAEQCVITINAGKGQGKLLLSCDSWGEGTALLEVAMENLDKCTGLKT